MSRRDWANLYRARRVEANYARALGLVAGHIGDIVNDFIPLNLDAVPKMLAALNTYKETLKPWAESTAARIAAETEVRDRRLWRHLATEMGIALRREIWSAPTGLVLQDFLARQVHLITSLPTYAGERVQKLTLEAISSGTRASVIAKEIELTGEVTESRAMLIARTQVSTMASNLTRVRSEHLGSTHFIWRTSEDGAVRESHKRLNGLAFRWDDPPICDPPDYRAIAGAIFNCRCYCEPVLPEEHF